MKFQLLSIFFVSQVLFSGVSAVEKSKSERTRTLFTMGVNYTTINAIDQKLEFINYVSGFEFLLTESESFSIHPNLMYAAGLTNTNPDPELSGYYAYKYANLFGLDVPLKYKLYVDTKRVFSFVLASGPFVWSENLTASNHSFYGGLKVAAGVHISFPSSRWQLELTPFDMQFLMFSKVGYYGGNSFYNPGILFKYRLY